MIDVFFKTHVGRLIRKIVPKDKKGAILLEFAFSIPILITCLYYSTDVPQAFRMSNKTQWMCELYAQSAINLLNSRDDKRLNIDDLNGLSKLIACCITGTPENADLKGLKIEVEVAGSIQDIQFEKSAEGEYIIDRITGEYKKFSELGCKTIIDENDPSIVWVNYDNLYCKEVAGSAAVEEGVTWSTKCTKGVIIRYGCGIKGYCWHDPAPSDTRDLSHDESNDPGGDVNRIWDESERTYLLVLARTRYALPATKKCEISTVDNKINVDINVISGDTSVPPGKVRISTCVKSDKLFYMLPIKTIGTKESVTVSLPT